MKKLKEVYELEELPDPFITSIDLQEEITTQVDDNEWLLLFKKLEGHGFGTLYTQVDGEKDRCYVKGNEHVNRTGVYALVR